MSFHALLFTTTTCQKCPTFKAFVAEFVSFPVRILDDKAPDFFHLAAEHSVSSAPTMIIFDEEKKEVFRTSEQSDLDAFLKK